MLRHWLVRLEALFRREHTEAEFDEEVRFHLDRETERYVASGLTVESARRAALRDFGDPARVREEARETWRWRWLDEFLQDIRYAGRGLARHAGFTAVAALSLGFGIGATTTLFSVVDALDFRPLPYRDADRLVWLGEVRKADDRSCPGCPFGTSQSTAAFWASQARSLDSLALWSHSSVYFRRGDVADYVSVGYASAGFLDVLGVQPLSGRGILPEDTVSGAEPVVLLSHDAWINRFGGDRTVLGARFEYFGDPALADARVVTVVGVLPKDFHFGGEATFWFPLTGADPQFNDALARLGSGVTRAGAESELRAITARLAEADPARYEGREVSIVPLKERLGWAAGRGRFVLFSVTTLVLLIAIMNVTGLSLSRTLSRRSELAVRSSLGASPIRLVRQLVVEGLCLASIGSVIAGLFVIWGMHVAREWFRTERAGMPIGIDHRILAFSVGVAALAGVLTALLPSTHAARWNLQHTLGNRTNASMSPRVRWASAALLMTQIALGLVLVTGAGVLSSEFLKLRHLDLGFDPAGLYEVSLFGDRDLRTTPEAWRPTIEEARRRVAGVRGVEYVALRHSSAVDPAVVQPDVYAGIAAVEPQTPRVLAVDPSYFETFRTTLLAGSGFNTSDSRGTRPVCVVNAAAAASFWPDEEALGRQVFVGDSAGGEWLTVVGVIADVERGEMVERSWPTVYRPLDQAPLYHPAASLYVRIDEQDRGEVSMAALQTAVAEALGHPASTFRPLTTDLDERFRTQRFNALAFNLFAGFALLLAAIGIYGSVAYAVAQRTREIGVRVALGAEKRRVLKLVGGSTAQIAGAGLAVGLLGSFVMTHGLRVFVSATSKANPWTLVLSSLLVGVVALVATYLPARRAIGVDPLIALRTD